MRITPELIDHRDFHRGIWLRCVQDPAWYYFSERGNPNLVSSKRFAHTVDPELRELVLFLHSRGYRTTPSCAGHLYSKNRLRRIFRNISREKERIRKHGIYLQDPQTEKVYRFKQETYELPWCEEEFVSKLYSYQQKGIIGVRVGNALQVDELENCCPEGILSYTEGDIRFFYLPEIGHKKAWHELTRRLKQLL
jgi:hypothetical protein